MSIHTRPDITYTVNVLSRFGNDPGIPHVKAVKHVIAYIAGTLDYCLTFYAKCSPGSSLNVPIDNTQVQLVAYVDADLGGNRDNGHSQTGYCIFIFRSLIAWSSTDQGSISLSTAESELKAIKHLCTDILLMLRNIMNAIGFPQNATVIYEDNKAVLDSTNQDTITRGLRYVEISLHLLKDLRAKGIINAQSVESSENISDLMTKRTAFPVFNYLSPFLVRHLTAITD
jgi:hypothetical protein